MSKVLIIVPYSHPSKCGVWTRAWSDAQFLKSQGYDVTIFSSNIIKGTIMKSGRYEEIDNIKIKRFKVLFSLGISSMFWLYLRSFINLNPEIVHVHGYRHPHSIQGLILSKLSGKKVFITTHAPFEKDNSRALYLKIIDFLYDILIGWWELRLYNNVIRISHWEEKYLLNLGIHNSIYIPNGLSKIFETEEVKFLHKKNKRIIYMGRIDPIKRLEWMQFAAKALPEFQFYIRGPLNVYEHFNAESSNMTIIPNKYELNEFKKELSNADIYVLPSIREALPFTLLEAMSQGVICLSSNSKGGEEVIQDGANGFIFKTKDELVAKINYVYANWTLSKKIKENSILKSKEYALDKINRDLLEVYSSK